MYRVCLTTDEQKFTKEALENHIEKYNKMEMDGCNKSLSDLNDKPTVNGLVYTNLSKI